MTEEASVPASPQKAPIFSIIAAVFAFICLFAPLILITLPIMLSVGLAIVGVVRKERPRWLAPITIAVCVFLLFASSTQLSNIGGTSSENLEAAEIADWSWDVDPSFGTNGTIKWRVSIKNKTDKPIEAVKVDFTSYDASGKMLTSTFTYISAIPPMGRRDKESYADFYGTEQTANVTISSVRFSE